MENSNTEDSQPLTKEEFLTLWGIDYLGYKTPSEIAKANGLDLELSTLIFIKLEDLGLIEYDVKEKQLCNARSTDAAKDVLFDDQYYDYIPE